MKTKARNARGEEIEINDGDIVPSGFSIKVPMMLLDATQQAIAASTTSHRVVDGFGRKAGSRPGYCFSSDTSTEARDALGTAYGVMIHNARNAWRPKPDQRPQPDQRVSTGDAREDYKNRLSNAWRTVQDAPAAESKPADRHTADAAHAAMVARIGDAWRSR